MQEIQFDYFHGMEAEQYSFYRVPKVLFTAECFKTLSCEAKVLYGLMLDRMSLSMKNRWLDEEDRVYIIFTVEEIMELLGCGRQKAIKNIAELDTEKGIGLIEKKRLGLGKPNVIYVKNFMLSDCPETENSKEEGESAGNTQKYENQTSRSMKNGFQEAPESNFQKYENQTSGSMKNGLPEVPKSNCNNTDINKTDFSETEYSETEAPIPSYLSLFPETAQPFREDMIEKMDTYRALIQRNIDYECFQGRDSRELEEVDELVELMVEVMLLPDDSSVRIGGVEKPAGIVKNRFMKLTYSHMEYVLFSLQRNTSKVGNIRSYLLTTLYNSSMTISHYYQAEVNHDLYGGK